MVRLNVVAEGQTEETLVNTVLREHLASRGVYASVRCVETSRSPHRVHKGGIRSYGQLKRDLVCWMKQDQDQDVYFTTIVDLYMYPKDIPHYETTTRLLNPRERVHQLQELMRRDLPDRRFIPYIQLHEFEALLFSDPAKLSVEFPNRQAQIKRLQSVADQHASPELIDDGQETAPSKRIIIEIPEYFGMKASAGPLVAREIGLQRLREKCPHFAEWLGKIEALAGQSPDS